MRVQSGSHEKGSSRHLNGEALAGRPTSPSAVQCSRISSALCPDGPGAAGRQIVSPANKLCLVEEMVENLGDQRV